MKRSWKNVLVALSATQDWTLATHLPDGNGRNGCARGDVLRDMKQAGLIEYGKEPQQSLCGYRITPAGRAAIGEK